MLSYSCWKIHWLVATLLKYIIKSFLFPVVHKSVGINGFLKCRILFFHRYHAFFVMYLFMARKILHCNTFFSVKMLLYGSWYRYNCLFFFSTDACIMHNWTTVINETVATRQLRKKYINDLNYRLFLPPN